MDRGRCLEILEDCGVGPKAKRLIKAFWDNGVLVCKAPGCFGLPFKAGRGVTQDSLVSPTIFNLMVDAIIREWERLLIIRRISLGKIRTPIAAFYVDDGLIASCSPKTPQTAVDLLTGLFDRVGLQTNTTKTEVMVFVPSKICTALSKRAYRVRMDEDFRGVVKGRKVECSKYGKVLEIGTLAGHLGKQHDVYQSIVLEEERDGSPPSSPRRWDATYYPAENCYRCPVQGCPQGRDDSDMRDSWNVRWHFSYRHHGHQVAVAGECYRKCRLCGIQVYTTGTPAHEASTTCIKATATRIFV